MNDSRRWWNVKASSHRPRWTGLDCMNWTLSGQGLLSTPVQFSSVRAMWTWPKSHHAIAFSRPNRRRYDGDVALWTAAVSTPQFNQSRLFSSLCFLWVIDVTKIPKQFTEVRSVSIWFLRYTYTSGFRLGHVTYQLICSICIHPTLNVHTVYTVKNGCVRQL